MSKTSVLVENTTCADCGMLVEPATEFHPGIYCTLFKAGFLDPAHFLSGHGFIPDPAVWGEATA
jgi:hypothetical protein